MAAPTFELYKLLVEEVREARKARREMANLFTTLNLAGVGALGTMAQSGVAALLVWASVALVLTCIIWRTSGAYYTRLLGAKYAILYSVETELGIDPIQREWRALGDRTLFKFFSLERLMPILFAISYLVFIAYHVSLAEVAAIADAAVRPVLSLIGR